MGDMDVLLSVKHKHNKPCIRLVKLRTACISAVSQSRLKHKDSVDGHTQPTNTPQKCDSLKSTIICTAVQISESHQSNILYIDRLLTPTPLISCTLKHIPKIYIHALTS